MTNQELRNGWNSVKFGKMVTLLVERVDPGDTDLDRYVGLEHLDSGSFQIKRWGTPADVIGEKLHFWPGDIIFGKRRAYQRKLAVADFEGICSAHAMVLRAKSDMVLPEFLPFLMQSDLFMNRALEISVGSLSPTINWRALAEQEFPLPPLDEQRRIAELLLGVEKLINSYKDLEERLAILKNSRLSDFLNKYPKSNFFHKVRYLLIEEPKNGFSPIANDSGKGFRTVSLSSIIEGEFKTEGNIKYADVQNEQVSHFFVQKNDIFVVRGNGNRNLAGKCGISDQSFTDLFYPDLLIRLRFNPNLLHPQFAVLEWNHHILHGDLISRAKSTNGIWKINGQDIREHGLIVPPLKDQIRFLEEFTEYDNAKSKLLNLSEKAVIFKNQILTTLN